MDKTPQVLKLNKNWLQFEDKVEQRENGFWYVKDDTQEVPFFGTYESCDEEKYSADVFYVHRFRPAIYWSQVLYHYPNPNHYRYFIDNKWSDTPPQNETVRQMWNMARFEMRMP